MFFRDTIKQKPDKVAFNMHLPYVEDMKFRYKGRVIFDLRDEKTGRQLSHFTERNEDSYEEDK
jgi:hypothetical protein